MLPRSPACKYHLLVMPKRHTLYFDRLKPAEIKELHGVVKKTVAQARKNIRNFIGYNILSNNGDKRVNQRVNHCHMHLFLRISEEADPLKKTHKRPKDFSKEELATLEDIKKWLKI